MWKTLIGKFKNPKIEDIFQQNNSWKAIFAMILPTVIAQLIIATYQIVDKLISVNFGIDYIINANPDLSLTVEEAKRVINVATNYAGTVGILTFAFSLFIAMGTSIRFSIALGQGKKEMMAKVIKTGFTTSLFFASLITTIFWFVAPNIIDFQSHISQDPDNLTRQLINSEALKYARVLMLGLILLFTANFWAMLLRSEGKTVSIIFLNLLSCFLNIIFDFIFVFKYGMAGTALSTCVAWFMMVMVLFISLHYNKKTYLKINFFKTRFDFKICIRIILIGLTTLIENLALGFIVMINAYLLYELPDDSSNPGSLPVYVVINSGIAPWLVIITAPIIGIGYGARSLVAYSYGQKDFKKIWKYLIRIFILLVSFLVIVLIIIIAFGEYMLVIFGVDYDTAITHKIYIILQFMSFPLASVSYVAVILFQSTERPKISLFCSMQRTIFVQISCIFLGFLVAINVGTGGGVYYYLFLGLNDLISALIVIPFLIHEIIKKKKTIPKKLL